MAVRLACLAGHYFLILAICQNTSQPSVYADIVGIRGQYAQPIEQQYTERYVRWCERLAT